MSRRHVVLDALLVRSRPTGVGRSILELTRELARSDHGLRFTLLATAPDLFTDLAAADHCEVLACPEAAGGNLRKSWFTQVKLPGLCRRLGADLLHAFQFVAPLRCPCPTVVTVHDLAWLSHPETVERTRQAYYRFFVPRTLQAATAIVTNSEATAADVARWYPATAPRLAVTPFGTPSWARERAAACGEQSGEVRDRPFFLFVGTLEPRKNLEGLLTAYEVFLQQAEAKGRGAHVIPDLVLVGGKGWRDSNLQQKIQALLPGGRLTVVDYCDIDKLWEFYTSAHALLFPSLHEGFGFPILEAQAAGTPVLTANRGAMLEVGGTAVLAVDPENMAELVSGMEQIAFDETLRQALAVRGAENTLRWSWERAAAATVEVYRNILDPKTGK